MIHTDSGSVCPGANPVMTKIVGVGHALARGNLWFLDPVGQSFAFGVGNRLVFGFEPDLDLREHVRGRRPTH